MVVEDSLLNAQAYDDFLRNPGWQEMQAKLEQIHRDALSGLATEDVTNTENMRAHQVRLALAEELLHYPAMRQAAWYAQAEEEGESHDAD